MKLVIKLLENIFEINFRRKKIVYEKLWNGSYFNYDSSNSSLKFPVGHLVRNSTFLGYIWHVISLSLESNKLKINLNP